LELYTVVVGDLVGSSKLRDRQSLAQKIESVLALLSKQFEHDFIAPLILTRGMDELSGVLLSPKNSYNICTWLNEEIYPLRFRCAVVEGLLDVGVDSGSARKMDGEAFPVLPMVFIWPLLWTKPVHWSLNWLTCARSLRGIGLHIRTLWQDNTVF